MLEEYRSCIPTPSMTVETKHGKQHLKEVVKEPGNWRAGLTVAMVSVPLSIALGIASGTTPQRGVTTAIFGGLCGGLFASSDYNIIGPAGALSGMFSAYSFKWTDDVLPWLSLVSAAICAFCALTKLHTYMLFMPTAVFEGFTVGVALIIGLNQINFACGLTGLHKHGHFYMNVVESITHLHQLKWESVLVFAVEMPLLWFLMRKFPKIPWTVIIPVLSIPLGALSNHGFLGGFELLTLQSKYGMLEASLVTPLKPLTQLVPPKETMGFLIAALSTAVVAVLETLISAKIAATRVDRTFDELLEMRGLTISHVVCGLAGCMPPTGVFVRTSLNTNLGATHRFAQFLNAMCVLIIFMATMPAFSYMPQATIAALLVVASIRMTPMTYLKKLWRENKGALALCVVTALICVMEDPVVGLAVGMVIALLRGAKKTLVADSLRITSCATEAGGQCYTVKVLGCLTYLNSDGFISVARNLDSVTEVHLDVEALVVCDHDGATAINKVVGCWLEVIEAQNLFLTGVDQQVDTALGFFQWYQDAHAAGRVVILANIPKVSLPLSSIRLSTVSAEMNSEKVVMKVSGPSGSSPNVSVDRQEILSPVAQSTDVTMSSPRQFEHSL